MFAKSLIVAAVLASTAVVPAHADIKLNGVTLNGINLNGFTLNGINLNGFTLNGFTLNGINLNGFRWNGFTLNSHHQGVGLDGQVIAIEF
jgi:uncharacterized protein YjbI with pentapeptide repeats